MIEARLLPQNGAENQSLVAVPGNGAGGDKCGDVHAGVLPAAVHHHESVRVPNLRTDGKNSPRLGLGIGSELLRVMSNRHGRTRIFQPQSNNNGSRNLQLVPAVPKLSAGAAVASRRYGLWYLDVGRDVDILANSTFTVMPFSLLLKLLPLAGLVGGAFAFIETGGPLSFVYGAAGSGTFLALVGFARWLIERRDKKQSEVLSLSRTDAQFNLEREKLIDTQTVALLKQWEEFYGFRDREKQSVIDLQKVSLQQRDEQIVQLQRLVTQQAGAIQQLQKGG